MPNKRVLVTGSSRGIGRAVAKRLAQDGWDVAVHYGHNRRDAESLVKELGDRSAGAYQADLGNLDEVRGLWSRVMENGPLDALVNNAGVYVTLDYCHASDDVFSATLSRCMKVNFEAPAWLTRAACREFVAHGGGKVVNVASRVGHRGEAGAAPYSASKAALINLTRALAVEHAKLNIQHFAIAPGWVDTAMARDGMKERLPEILSGIPLGRMATPADCAAVVAFLLTDEASYLSGDVIDINGASYLR
ncbi:MAG: SDR family oxidoreductase [Armatimonadetes bacterium]|nr:SDR family oxidoreductase [Armatimonadota bacterium]